MPIEIKKLIVKAVVESNATRNESSTEHNEAPIRSIDQEIIIKQCVKQVLQILKQSKKR